MFSREFAMGRILVCVISLHLLVGCSSSEPKSGSGNPPAPIAPTVQVPAQVAKSAGPELDFPSQRKAFKTQLTKKGPSPQRYNPKLKLPEGVKEVVYTSGELKLKAYYALPEEASATKKVPVFVYYHGGFAFGAGDLDDAVPAFQAGFAVLMPTLRGENGNPGFHELYFGELDDARAALEWIKTQPELDAAHVYTFGHSAGGVLSALLALYPDTPARITGSAGGLYDEKLFDADDPFDITRPEECRLRVMSPNAQLLKLPHYGYVGTEDQWVVNGARTAKRQSDLTHSPLKIYFVKGDHHGSLEGAMEMYLKVISEDAFKGAEKK